MFRAPLIIFLGGVFAIAGGVRADIASDYAAITSGVTTINSGTGTPSDCAIFGRTAFPFIRDNATSTVGAAGLYNDSADGGRGVALSHTIFYDPNDTARGKLLENLAQWAGKKASPLIGVSTGQSSLVTYFQGKGYTVRTINSSASNLTSGGVTVDVYFANMAGSGFLANVQAYTATGRGFILSSTAWAMSAANFDLAQTLLTPYGIGFKGTYAGSGTLTIPAAPYSSYYSALPAVDALNLDRAGTITLSLADKTRASDSIDKVFAVRSDLTELNTLVEQLSTSYGWIMPTKAAPVVKANQPVEAMLARYQWRTKFDVLPPSQFGTLFANGIHPATSDWPGLPAAGTPVTKLVSINGNTPEPSYMNQGDRATRVETGLYAGPGAVVTLTIPAGQTGAGLEVHIGGSQDDCFNLGTWSNFPRIWRRTPLSATTTQVGNVFGGLITILVPPNLSLGTFDVTIAGALEAPAFVLGRDTDEDWNTTLKNHPGAWGYIQTSKLTIYLPRWQLNALKNATQIAQYWQTVMDTMDHYYGYDIHRKRGEVMSANRQVAFGAAYAGYPIELGWGADTERELNTARLNGEWGSFHELGHGFQHDFDGNFGIAIGAEIDVNIGPAFVSTLIHDRSPWDNFTHTSYDATDRIAVRANFFGLPAGQQTWETACATYPMAYDLYFNLGESFGWDVYRTAFGRLMAYLKSTNKAVDDPELFALNSGDPNYVRNRFFLLFCTATHRNLTNYFARYGIKSGGATYGLTPSVIVTVQGKGYAVWDGNLPATALSNPGTLTLAEDLPPGSAVAAFTTTDPDPGEIVTYQITGGNTDGAFTIDKHSGALAVSPTGLDWERRAAYSLTVTSFGGGIPFGASVRPSRAVTFAVNVTNKPEAPVVGAKLFTADSAMTAGQAVGTVTAAIENGRSLSAWQIATGNSAGHFSLDAAGVLHAVNPAALPNPGVVELIVRATDSTGAMGYGRVNVVCNTPLGVTEQRWAGQNVFTGTPAFTGHLTAFASAQNVGSDYSRMVNGYVIPQVTGYYRFAIASDDSSQLFLSSTADPLNAELIASVNGYTNPEQWTKFGSQQAAPIRLEAGRAYYLEARQVEGGGGDHVSVGWLPPDGAATVVIPQAVLIPRKTGITFAAGPTAPPTVLLDSPLDGATSSLGSPVPLAATVLDNQNVISKVRFLAGGTIITEDATPPYAVVWNNAPEGMHSVTAEVLYVGGAVVSESANISVLSVPPPGNTLDFGNVGIKSGWTRTFAFPNSGGTNLEILGVTTDGVNAELFVSSVPSLTTLPPGGSAIFTVRFLPLTAGLKTAALHITTSAASFDLNLTGAGVTAVNPLATTLAATVMAFDSAELHGTVDPKGSLREVMFDYGVTAQFGSVAPAVPASVGDPGLNSVTATLANLLPHTKYYCRVRAEGPLGKGNGATLTFTTANRSPAPTPNSFTVSPGATVALTVIDDDTDPDGDVLSVASFIAPPAAVGKVVKQGNTLLFTAAAGFTGGSFTYTAKDAFGGSASATVTLLKGGCVIDPTSVSHPSARITYDVDVTATGAWSAVETLTWASVSTTPGSIHGTGSGKVHVQLQPNAAVKARAGTILIGGQSHSITQAGVLKPVLSDPPGPIPAGIVSGDYSLKIPTTNFPVKYTVTNLPPGLTINGDTGFITGKPTKNGVFNMKIKAANAAGTADHIVNITINIDKLPDGFAGAFHGFIEHDADLNGNLASRLELTVATTGAVSGKLITGATSVPFKGVLDTTVGETSAGLLLSLPRKNAASLDLDVELDSLTNTLAGNLSEQGGASAAVTGWRNVWSTANKAGAYYRKLHTFVLRQDDPDASLPQGHGYGSWPTVTDSTGAVKISGRLADGNTFSTATFMGPQGQLLLYQSLYGNKGSLAGVLDFAAHDETVADNSVTGAVFWFKPPPAATSKDTLYKDGFGPIPLTASGSAYPVPPPGEVVMGLPDNTSDNARLSFADGGLDLEAEEFDLTLKLYNPTATGRTNKADVPPHPNLVKLPTLDAAKGVFSGAFTLPGSTPALNRKVSFQGQIIRLPSGETSGYGYFIMGESNAASAIRRSGSVLLRDAAAP